MLGNEILSSMRKGLQFCPTAQSHFVGAIVENYYIEGFPRYIGFHKPIERLVGAPATLAEIDGLHTQFSADK